MKDRWPPFHSGSGDFRAAKIPSPSAASGDGWVGFGDVNCDHAANASFAGKIRRSATNSTNERIVTFEAKAE